MLYKGTYFRYIIISRLHPSGRQRNNQTLDMKKVENPVGLNKN